MRDVSLRDMQVDKTFFFANNVALKNAKVLRFGLNRPIGQKGKNVVIGNPRELKRCAKVWGDKLFF